MAHIVIDARNINSSTGRYIERLVTHLQDIKTDHRFTIVVPSKDREFWTPTSANFKVAVANYPNYSISEQLQFGTFLRSLQPDLVHFCMPQQPVFYRGAKVTSFLDLTLLKTYISGRGWLTFQLKQLAARFVFRRAALDSNHLITISRYTQRDVIRRWKVSSDNVSVIYPASDVSHVKSEPVDAPVDPYIMYVGQFSEYKNIRRLGDAHQLLLKTHPSLKLVLVGRVNASANILRDYFESSGYEGIVFTDYVTDGQLNSLYAGAAAYAFPSLMEGFGLPGIEAMSHGVPVASSNATCLPEIYGHAAEYFDPVNTREMAAALERILTDPHRATELVQAGYRQAGKYSWERQAQRTFEVYVRVLQSVVRESDSR